ncbi:MAG: xanthine dehydrogenase family protein molybdopterin-binding subunit [Dehalococcoidia bacterium]|nr:xanthine dehydrogenase family protein molybdopterin-binding subunit [Dehalococcoidia bacterium]
MTAPASQIGLVGQSVKRVEDPILLTGRAKHIDDLHFPDMLHTAILRSPYPHATIVSIDASAALALPGVVAVLTGEELVNHAGPSRDYGAEWYALAVGKVRYVGEPVVAVAATSRYVAEDALDLIDVEYDPLPAVANARQAIEADAPRLYPTLDTNIVYKKTFSYGDPGRALEGADLVVTGKFRIPRLSANPMETAGVISQFDPATGGATSWSNVQAPAVALGTLVATLGIPMDRARAMVQPHGGSFGSKIALGKFIVITTVLSKLCGGRPVKYIEDRIEHLMASGSHAWEREYDVGFGFDRAGHCLGWRMVVLSDVGATGGPTQTLKALTCLVGPYRVRDVEYDITTAVSNKGGDGPYRGYGPPTHFLVIERMMDKAAAALGLDPAEIRRRNFIQPEQFPYMQPNGVEYDSGNYPEVLRVALERAGYEELRKEQERLRSEGRLAGIGVAFGVEPGGFRGQTGPYREWPAGGSLAPEAATIHLQENGDLVVDVYFAMEGQGHFTFATQVVAAYFGVPMERVRVVSAEPRLTTPSTGPMGSRQSVTLTFALRGACDLLREKLLALGAHMLDLPAEDLGIRDGRVVPASAEGKSLSLGDLAAVMHGKPADMPVGLDLDPSVTCSWTAPPPEDREGSPYLTYANGCHVVLLEVDRETGQVAILKYVIADDCGTRLNPRVVEGITQGGLAQGIGFALLEEYVYSEDGQPLSVSFMDYLLPTIYEVPLAEKAAVVTPSPATPYGQKGAGEGAIHVTPAAVFCAVNDALAPLGVELTQAPASPRRIWEAIQASPSSG